jgi:phosphoserine/homoserine phosphotransferase
MRKLGWPTLFCNSLIIDENNKVIDYQLRQQDGKKHAVKALQSIGFTVIAAGDSYNDVTMLQTGDRGIFFRPPDSITAEFPQFPVTTTYEELTREIDAILLP